MFSIIDEFKKYHSRDSIHNNKISMTDDEIETMDGYKQATIRECHKNGFCYICVKQPDTRKYGRKYGPQKMNVVFDLNTYYICGRTVESGYTYQCTPFFKGKTNIFKKDGAITTCIKKLKTSLV